MATDLETQSKTRSSRQKSFLSRKTTKESNSLRERQDSFEYIDDSESEE